MLSDSPRTIGVTEPVANVLGCVAICTGLHDTHIHGYYNFRQKP